MAKAEGLEARLQQALEDADEARRAAADAEQRKAAAQQQLEHLVQLGNGEQCCGGSSGLIGGLIGSFKPLFGRGGGRKGGGEAVVQQQDSPSQAAGREQQAAAALRSAAAPTASMRLTPPRLLRCYEAAPIGFGPTEQQQALEGLARAVECFAEGCLPRISCSNANAAAAHLMRALDNQRLLGLLWPEGAFAPGGAPTETGAAYSKLQELHGRQLLVPALVHMALRWMQSELWQRPLSLAGLGSAAEEVLTSSDAAEEEQEAALQLRALCFQRLFRQFKAGGGQRLQAQGRGAAISLPLSSGWAADLHCGFEGVPCHTPWQRSPLGCHPWWQSDFATPDLASLS